MRTPRDPIYAGHRYPAEIISYSVWLYFRFPLSLRMVEEMLAARGISVTHETIRQWGLKFGREFANRIRRRALAVATNGTSMRWSSGFVTATPSGMHRKPRHAMRSCRCDGILPPAVSSAWKIRGVDREMRWR
jgi:putative transposase